MSTHPRRNLLGRSCALAFGLFCLLNLLGRLWARDFDATLWLLDLRFLPHATALVLVGLLGLALLFLGLGFAAWFPRMGRVTCIIAWAGAVVALVNALMCWRTWAAGASHSSFPIPFSIVVVAGLASAGMWYGEMAGGIIARSLKLVLGASAQRAGAHGWAGAGETAFFHAAGRWGHF